MMECDGIIFLIFNFPPVKTEVILEYLASLSWAHDPWPSNGLSLIAYPATARPILPL